jgi:hypothetical protein
MITNWRWSGLVVALVAICPAFASAENGRPSQETLKAMGLSGMEVMSDEQAMSVRGQGFTFAGGLSWAFVGPGFPNAASVNVSFSGGDYWSAQANSSYADRLNVNVTEFVLYPNGTTSVSGNANYTRYTSGGATWAQAF